MKTWASALAILLASSGYARAELPDDQKKPELVKIGMSKSEVEGLMGAGTREVCWIYERNDLSIGVCFVDGLANSYNESPLADKGSHTTTLRGWVAGNEWPPKRLPSPDSTKVELGTSMKRVKELWGDPKTTVKVFTKAHDVYSAAFAADRLTDFRYIPPTPFAELLGSFNVYFNFGESEPVTRAGTALLTLRAVVKHWQLAKEKKVVVNGHCDTAEPCNDLSRIRAENVGKTLVELGVDASKIEIAPHGSAQLLVLTAPGVREPQNRRVEVVLKWPSRQ